MYTLVIKNYNPTHEFWRDFIGYFTSHGQNSPDSDHTITPACIYICPPIASVEEKHGRHYSFKFSFLLVYMEGNQNSLC